MTRNQTASQTIVVVAMGLVAAAGAAALHKHGGMPGPVAATAALSAYLLLLAVHAVLWRRERNALKPARPAQTRASAPARPQDPLHKTPPSIPMPPPVPNKGLRPGAGAPQGAHPTLPLPQAPAATRPADRVAPPPLPQTPSPIRTAGGSAAPAAQDDLQDLWSFRPAAAEPKLPPFVAGRVSAPATAEPTLPSPQAPRQAPAPQPRAAAPQHATPPPKASAPREADVEVIQDAIKRLLEEVNAAEQSRAHGQGAPAAKAAGPQPPPLPQHAAQQAASYEASIDRSIDALRMTAGTMRSALGAQELAGAPPTAAPELPPFVRGAAAQARTASAAEARARLMADAISAGRIDVSLEPILGLEDQQTRHYEVTVRLRDADGNPLTVTPDGPDLTGTGLLPLFDGVRVTRTAAVARRLEERGKGGSVFSAFSGESVADEHFLGELAETLHQRAALASQLVLSFTQSDVRGFSTPEWDSLADMRALGFRFAITHLTDLDMDFEALAEQGFVFAKLDAAVFLDGLRAPSGHLPASDVCRHLARHGLTLVVERIDDEQQLARVFGFGVLLGQGQLFGGARSVKADVVRGRARGNTVAA